MEVFNTAMKNVMPVLEVKARRVGGANYQVRSRFVLTADRPWLSVGWLIMLKRGGKSMQEKLAMN